MLNLARGTHLITKVVDQLIHESGSVRRKARLLATAGPYLQKAPMYPHIEARVQKQGIENWRRLREAPENWR
jgi:hypothetical protein